MIASADLDYVYRADSEFRLKPHRHQMASLPDGRITMVFRPQRKPFTVRLRDLIAPSEVAAIYRLCGAQL